VPPESYLDSVVTTKRFICTAAAAAVLLTPLPAMSAEPEIRVLYEASETVGSTAIDSSSFHNDGRLLGGVTRRNGAYRFHSLSSAGHRFDRIRAPFDPSFNPERRPFSYGARVRVSPQAEWSHAEMAVLRHGDLDTSGGDYKLELRKTPTGIVVAFCAMHDDDGEGTGYVRSNGALETIADGRWHTLTCRRVDGNRVSLTIDGVEKTRRTSGDLGSMVNTDPLLIGVHLTSDRLGLREQFVGLMDDIHVTVE
jgi:hypothetical protein